MLNDRMEVIGFCGPIRALLTPDGKYVNYYIRPEAATARLGWIIPKPAANDGVTVT